MKALGLEVFADSKADRLRLPCAMLQGTACSIYEERFTVCRTFECRTLKAAKSGEIGIDAARDIIAEAKARLARVTDAGPELLQADARHRTFRQGPPAGDAVRGRAFIEMLALDNFLDRHFRNKPVDRGFEELKRQ
jgi:hypothetical protein